MNLPIALAEYFDQGQNTERLVPGTGVGKVPLASLNTLNSFMVGVLPVVSFTKSLPFVRFLE